MTGRARLIAILLLVAGVVGWPAWNNWSYHHPAQSHDCRMLATQCLSHYAEWVPNGGSVPLYGKCACAAKVTVRVGTR